MDSRYFDIVGGNIPGEPEIIWPLDLAKKQRAEFLRPNRAEIILKEKENPSIDDVLEHE